MIQGCQRSSGLKEGGGFLPRLSDTVREKLNKLTVAVTRGLLVRIRVDGRSPSEF
jgi:hypothetical protein